MCVKDRLTERDWLRMDVKCRCDHYLSVRQGGRWIEGGGKGRMQGGREGVKRGSGGRDREERGAWAVEGGTGKKGEHGQWREGQGRQGSMGKFF